MSIKVVGLKHQHTIHFAPEEGDAGHAHRVRRFLDAMQQAVFEANRAVIGRAIPELDKEGLLRLAVRVAELRAEHVRKAVEVAAQPHPTPEAIRELTALRTAIEELVAAFEAAERLVERGYVQPPH